MIIKPIFLKGKIFLATREGIPKVEVDALFFRNWQIHKGVNNTFSSKYCLSYLGYLIKSGLTQRDCRNLIRKIYEETNFEELKVEDIRTVTFAMVRFVNLIAPILDVFNRQRKIYIPKERSFS